MKKTLQISTLFILILCTSCCRSRCEVWEDTKTCGRYFGKGMRSLFGHHEDEREYVTYLDNYQEENAYLSLTEEIPYEHREMSDYIPAPKESPGDPGSSVPGIHQFYLPSAAIFKNIYFSTDNYSVNESENLSKLKAIADYLSRHPTTYLSVEGHADERGAAAYNLALGSRRANAIRNFLIQNGAHPDQVFTISYGKERPVAMGHEESSWWQNRRGQFKIYEK
ncbi:MAG: OmpA family protein [Chlamydiales bacterium]